MVPDLANLDSCPACEASLKDHRYALIASIIEDSKDTSRVKNFLQAIKSRTWLEVISIDEFRGDADVIQVYSIRCPAKGLVLVLIDSPFELFFNDRVIGIEFLSAAESRELEALIGNRNWKPGF